MGEVQLQLKELEYLSPKPLIVKGSLSYSESLRCNNTLRIKREVMKMFGESPDKYVMECHQSYSEFLERVCELVKQKEGVPILLYLCKK